MYARNLEFGLEALLTWHTVLSTFGLVFLAELGDKTQLAVMTQTCRFRRPWPVFVGASTALMLSSAMGVLGGGILGAWVSPAWIHTIAGMGFAIMGILMLCEKGDDVEGAACELDAGGQQRQGWDWQVFGVTFSLLFVAELGDKTQLAVLGLAASHHVAWEVFLGATLALTSITALAVASGQWLAQWLPRRRLLWLSGALFIALGTLMVTGVL